MPESTIDLTGDVQIEAAAGGGKPRRFVMLAYGGGELRVTGYPLPVVVDLAGMAPRSATIPVYLGHSDGSNGDRLVGHADAFDTSAGRLRVTGAVSAANAKAGEVLAAHDNGYPWQASIGALPDRDALEEIPAGRTVSVNGRSIAGPVIVARKSILRHIAILPEGADANTSLSIAAGLGKEDDMSKDTTTTQTTDADRVRQLWASAKWQDNEGGPRERAETAMVEAAAGRMPLADFRVVLLQERLNDSELARIRGERPLGPAIHASSRDVSDAVIEAAFAKSTGIRNLDKLYKPEVLEAADRHGTMGLQEVILQAAYANGYTGGRHRITTGNYREVMQAAFINATAPSTHSASGILSNVANKVILDGWSMTEQVWRAICRVRPVSDFKVNTLYRLTDDLEYVELPPSGEIQHGTMGEESYTLQAKTYARMLGLSRPDIINDDLGAFDTIRERLGRGAGLRLNRLFWTAFLDDAAFFTEARGNLITDALSTDPASLDDAVAAFQALTDENGHPLGVAPSILLTCPAQSATAKRLYVASEMRDTTASTSYVTANVYQGAFRPEISAYLSSTSITGYSATAWWLLADPSVLPVMMVGFLDGRETPVIESADFTFETLGVQFRGYHDIATSKAEWRGGVKSTGVGG